VAKVVIGMRSVEQAQAELLTLCAPLSCETINIAQCFGRVVAEDVLSARTHPPFSASAMDGYALQGDDLPAIGTTFDVVGESIAGSRYSGALNSGEAVRIFTGAPVPPSCGCVIVQEDVTRIGNLITIKDTPQHAAQHIRPAGLDVKLGQLLAAQGARITAALQGLLAAAGIVQISVVRQPKVQLLACGDELKLPGAVLGPDDIVATNGLILASLLRSNNAIVTGETDIVTDDLATITSKVAASDADILITIGGASVGDRDFVHAALKQAGSSISFWKIALKPGKPMMVGTRGKQIIIGLPGNPVSAYVCALLFVLPALRALQGAVQPLPIIFSGITTVNLPPSDTRTEFLRSQAVLEQGRWLVTPHPRQDSSMVSTLAASNALLRRMAGASAIPAGALVDFLLLDS
jgi:molybdopterin molybdotransferase